MSEGAETKTGLRRRPGAQAATEKAEDSRFYTGTIGVIYPQGYGFIQTGTGSRDVFVLARELKPRFWKEGQTVRFQIKAGRPGTRAPQAIHVEAIDEEGRTL